MHRKLPLIALLCLGLSLPAMGFKLDLNKVGNLVKQTGKLVSDTDPEEEQALGANMAATLLGASKLDDSQALQTYVNRVGRWIASHSERPDLDWRFAVLADDSVNAFAAPGGYVFVTRGLIDRMQTEAELAGVLAHEIIHVERQHHLRAIKKQAGVGILANIASIAADQEERGEDLNKVILASQELYARGLDKDDEFEADRHGVVLAARAGYDPYGLPFVLHMLDAMNADDTALALMFKTHPRPFARLESLHPVLSTHLAGHQKGKDLRERYGRETQ